jgi:hypothetical protein
MKRLYWVIGIIALVLVGAFIGIRKGRKELIKARPANALPIKQKEKSPIDLRPAAIAKLQGLIKDGSRGLYKLRIDSLQTDISDGSITLVGVGVYPDSSVIPQLHRAQQLPDDVFRIEMAMLRISGIGLDDIVHKRDMDIRAIACARPRISIYHKLQPYNADDRARAKQQTLFSRLKGQIDRLAIDRVHLTGGTIFDYNGDVRNTFKDVNLDLGNILINESAERDHSRFMFAKTMQLRAGKITMPVGHSGYDLNIGGITVLGGRQTVVVQNLSLDPRGGKEAFARRQKHTKGVFTITVPRITLHDADWWSAAHGEALRAADGIISNPRVNVYMDKRMPSNPTVKRDNFPQQLLAQQKMKVSLRHVEIKGGTLVYEEFNDKSKEKGSISFNNLNMVADGATNVLSEVAQRPIAFVRASCLFMNKTPMKTRFELSLKKEAQGAFKTDLDMGAMGYETVNPFSPALSLVTFTSGQMESGAVHSEGNNNTVRTKATLRYTDLHMVPMKATDKPEEPLKERKLMGKVANAIFIKDNNPSRGELRQPEITLNRSKEPNFFNFIWMSIRMAMLKTIGVPAKMSSK